jgi:hypothetical protein
MPNLNYNPETEIPDLSGKTIFITGGESESVIHFEEAGEILTSLRNKWTRC